MHLGVLGTGVVGTTLASRFAELVDGANPLDFSGGFPPSLAVANTDSLGEQVQRAFPAARVVKARNTVTAAKAVVRELLAELGWGPERVHDLGGIEAARGTEMYPVLWLRLIRSLGTAEFSVRVIR